MNENQAQQFDRLRALLETAASETNTEKQHKATDAATVVYNETIAAFGIEAFRPYLADRSADLRLAAAHTLLDTDPDSAIPVLAEINQNASGLTSIGAYTTLFELRRQGKLPAEIRI